MWSTILIITNEDLAMINKFQAMSMIRKPEFCKKTKEDGYDCYFVNVKGNSVGVVLEFYIGEGDKFSYSANGKVGTCKNIMQAFAQVVEKFVEVYNHVHRKDDYPSLGRDLLNICILRKGKFIPGDIIYLNDGDYGIIESVLNDGFELLMNSSYKYHCVMSDGRGVTVFGHLELNHGLSVDWNKTFSKFYEDTLNEKNRRI